MTHTSAKIQRQQAQRINLITAIADGLLGVIKIIVGKITYSSALVADGIHSLADLVTDLLVMIATHFGRQAPDKQHPYGHGRIETMASLGLGLLLLSIAFFMGWDCLKSLWTTSTVTIGYAALVVTIAALLIKEGIFHWTLRLARQQRSPLLEASAWHSRSDSFSSLIVLIGLLGSLCGIHWLDPLAALLVSALVGRIGARTLWHAGRELIDTNLNDDEIAAVRQSALSVPELQDLHDLRARRVGAAICLDVHLLVDNQLSASEAHEIGNAVVRAIRTDHPDIIDTTFHVDVEDDRRLPPKGTPLPLRHEIIAALDTVWHDQPWWQARLKLTLHYQLQQHGDARAVDIELYLPSTLSFSEAQLQAAYASTASLTWRGQLSVWHAAPCHSPAHA